MPKAHTQLLEGALASGVHNFDCGRPGGVYAALVRNAKMEILVKSEIPVQWSTLSVRLTEV
jgi:hypothetical protein